jgi:hypothetical protein
MACYSDSFTFFTLPITIILNHVWVPWAQKLCIVGLFIKVSTYMVNEIIVEYDNTPI